MLKFNMLEVAKTSLIAFVAYKAYKLYTFADKALDPIIGGLADDYVSLTNPLVYPQIKFKSDYFNDFTLKPEVLEIVKRQPKLFERAFMLDGTIKGEYLFIIDNNKFYGDDNLPEV